MACVFANEQGQRCGFGAGHAIAYHRISTETVRPMVTTDGVRFDMVKVEGRFYSLGGEEISEADRDRIALARF
ncbi:hypothetical protein KDJ57_gp73 [Gordonia phage Catfish]|uniref:Uncharacterized protein n=1 Tax=Gordonia phage Catfish TaxID=2301538 RepID=A0A385D0J7_9CAUD|nr:hypothetical protein KDJ57_gp73 [Gordonia phage Catfish]AXQ51872.1 hypothetical protein SEA_CATFISH_36 [Gordonia phage Catfish]